MSQHMFTFDDGAMWGASWMIGSPLGGVLWGILVVIGMAGWIALARSSLVQGGHMERSDRVPQLYGYSVCLIAIVVMLANVSTIVNTAFTLSDPLAGNGMYGWNGVVLSSFHAYTSTEAVRRRAPRNVRGPSRRPDRTRQARSSASDHEQRAPPAALARALQLALALGAAARGRMTLAVEPTPSPISDVAAKSGAIARVAAFLAGALLLLC